MAEEARLALGANSGGLAPIIGGCLAILPVFGFGMLPLGLVLLADDIPPLRRRGAIACYFTGSTWAGQTGSPPRGARGELNRRAGSELRSST